MALRNMAASVLTRALTVSRVVAPAAVYRAAAISAPCQQSLSASSIPSMAGSRMHLAIRCFASVGADAHLADLLKNELEFELGDYTPPDEIADGPPAPWSLHEEEGDTLLTLVRDFHGEQIQVFVSGEDQVEDEDQQVFQDDEGEVDVQVDVGTVFDVSILKGDQSFVFKCRSDGSYLQLTHVGLEPSDEELAESAYTGPVFDELDEEVQKALEGYLRERGVNEKLGEYIMAAINDKEQREYVSWMQRVQDFVKQ